MNLNHPLRQMNPLIRIFLASAMALGLASTAMAGDADGFYKPTELSGYVRIAGKTLKLPLKELRAALLKNGVVVVQDKRIPVDKVKWAEVMEEFRFKGLDGPASTSSPSSVVLWKRGDEFIGRTSTPLIITQKGKVKFITVKARMDTRLDTRIRGDILIMQAPVRISALGVTAKGRITMRATRMPTPPFPIQTGADG